MRTALDGPWASAQAVSGQPVYFVDRHIVDAGLTAVRQPIGVERPLLVAMATEPPPFGVVPLIGKARGDVATRKGPQGPPWSEWIAPWLIGGKRDGRDGRRIQRSSVTPSRSALSSRCGPERGRPTQINAVPGSISCAGGSA